MPNTAGIFILLIHTGVAYITLRKLFTIKSAVEGGTAKEVACVKKTYLYILQLPKTSKYLSVIYPPAPGKMAVPISVKK
jgi:hypothetical protein